MSQVPKSIRFSHKYVLALGANIAPEGFTLSQVLPAAISMLNQHNLKLTEESRLFLTPAFPAGSGPDFVNMVAVCCSDESPDAVLSVCHQVEAAFGRVRDLRWGARTLDIDLIAAGENILPDVERFRYWHDLPLARQTKEAPDQLILPHPRLQDRAFVLVPMAEVAPDWRHPVLHKTVLEMRDALPAADLASVRPLSG